MFSDNSCLKHSFYIVFLLVFFLCNQLIFAQEKQFVLDITTVTQSNTESETLIKKYSAFQGDSTQVLNRLTELISDFQNNGYISASIDSVLFDSTFVNVQVFTGKHYSWGKLNIAGIEPDLVHSLKINPGNFQNQPIRLNEVNQMKEKIISYYENKGFPFIKVLINSTLVNDSTFAAKLDIDKGKHYLIDTILIKGDTKFSRNYLYHSLDIKPGDEFSQKKISTIETKFKDISFISQVKPAELEFRDSGVDLYFYLKNKKANQFNGIIGFLPNSGGSTNNSSGKLLITGELNLYLINSFRKGEEFAINWEKTETSTQKLSVGFKYPYLFKLPVGIDTDFELYKKDSTFLSLNWNTGILFILSPNNYAKVYYKYKSSTLLGDKLQQVSTNMADVESNTYGVSLFYRQLDNKLNPRRGVDFTIFGGIGTKLIQNYNSMPDSVNFSIDNNLLESEAGLNVDIYFPIYKNFVFHFGNVSRYLNQYADSDKEAFVFENEMYRFGGAKTLRGFDENAFVASIYSVQNVEIRYLFEENSAFYLFWNGAYYYKKLIEKTIEDFPQGFGAGINFETKAGIFSLSYALGQQFDNPVEIKAAKIHFGYISRF